MPKGVNIRCSRPLALVGSQNFVGQTAPKLVAALCWELMNNRIFQNPAAQARIAAWYETFLARIPAPIEYRDIETSLGKSHVLLVGDISKPPLVCLHGALASSAHVVSELGPLLERFYIIAPDIPGQSARGPQVRPSPHDDSHQKWLIEILDGLDIESCDIYGASWGAYIALQTAIYAPTRVKRLVLIVPLGFVMGSLWQGLTRAALPMLAYRLTSSPQPLNRFLRSQFTTWDAEWARYMADAMRDYVFYLQRLPFVRPQDVANFSIPTLIIAADKDLSFPGQKLIARVRKIFPNAQTHLLTNCRHIPPFTEQFRRNMAARISEFLET